MNIKKGPWTVTDSKIVYKNLWMGVREDKVIRPDGKNGIFGVVTMRSGVCILPVDNDNNVYLTQEYHYAIERETIEVVSGGIDGNEDPETAAKRELKEEVGISAGKLIGLGKIYPLTSLVEIENNLFLARDLEFAEQSLEGTEVIKIIKASMKEAVKWVFDGKISDGSTVALVLKAKNYLEFNK